MSILIPLYDGSQGGQALNIVKWGSHTPMTNREETSKLKSIIILPEIGTRTPTRSINSLAQIQSSSRIFEFPCSLSPDDGMIWASLIQKANDLLDVILQQPQLWSVGSLLEMNPRSHAKGPDTVASAGVCLPWSERHRRKARKYLSRSSTTKALNTQYWNLSDPWDLGWKILRR